MIKLKDLLIESPSYHALERINDRMKEIGYESKERKKVAEKALEYTRKSRTRSEAVRLFTIPNIHGIPWSDKSNGDEIWAIIRDNTLVTVMFRRHTQPKTTKALRVDKITIPDKKSIF